MEKKTNFTLNAKYFLLVLFSIVLSFVPFYNMVIKGPYRWHIVQPRTVLGAILVLVFFLAIVATYLILGRKAIFPIIFFPLLYLSLNGVILPFATSLIYFEMVAFVGFAFCTRILRMSQTCWLSNIITGICLYSGAGLILSIIRSCFHVSTLGYANLMRILTLVLFFISVLLDKRPYESISQYFINYLTKKKTILEFILLSFIVMVVVVLFAKTQTAHSYDCVWYGLRPEYVLYGDYSIYDNFNLKAFVHYYPKLTEFVLIPLSELNDYSFIISGNIFFFIFLIVALKNYLDDNYSGISNEKKLLIMLAISSIPALANTSATAKPDIFGAFLVFAGFKFLTQYIANPKIENAILGCVSLLLATGTKHHYLLWGGIIFICFSVQFFYNFNYVKQQRKAILSFIPLIALSFFVIFCIHIRTVLLTGYPLYPIGLNFWEKLGFHGKEFMLTTENSNLWFSSAFSLKLFLKRTYQIIFNPTKLAHIIMLWTSNLWVLSIIIMFFCFKFSAKRKYLKNLILPAILLVVMIYYNTGMGGDVGADGNYFLIPVIILPVLLFQQQEFTKTKFFNVTLTILISTQLPIMYISHFSWDYATKEISGNILAENFDTEELNNSIFENYGIAAIAKRVSGFKNTDRVICGGDSNIINRLKCSVENYQMLSYAQNSETSPVASIEKFTEYLKAINIKALIVIDDDPDYYKKLVQEYVDKNMKRIEETILDKNAKCYVFRTFEKLPNPIVKEYGFYDDGWMQSVSSILVNAEKERNLVLTFYNPSNLILNETVDIFVDGLFVISAPVRSDSWTLKVPIKSTEFGTSSVEIKTDYLQKDTGKDIRELALVLSEVKLE